MKLKLEPIISGIVLAMLIKMLTTPFDIIGLVAVGFVVGYMVNSGPISGLVNSVIVGTTVGAIQTILSTFINSNASFQSFISYGFAGLAPTNFSALIYYLIYFCIIMGISGAIGGTLNKNNWS